MFWALVGAAFGAASTDSARGAEHVITIFGVVPNVCAWSLYFYLKRQQAKKRAQKTSERRDALSTVN